MGWAILVILIIAFLIFRGAVRAIWALVTGAVSAYWDAREADAYAQYGLPAAMEVRAQRNRFALVWRVAVIVAIFLAIVQLAN